MQAKIQYQISLRNHNKIKGTIKTKTGLSLQQIKCQILQIQGIKNIDSFIQQQDKDQKINKNIKVLILIEKSQEKKSSQRNRKNSQSSSLQIQSMQYQNQARQYIATQPQKPPIVRGQVKQSNSFFCCMSSTQYIELHITELKFYTNKKYLNVDKIIYINDIVRIKTYRKKQVYFIKIQYDEQSLDFQFVDKKICKQWMGYLMQAMQFNKYLNEKKLFSKAQSFKNYIRSIIEQHNQIVYLNPNPNIGKQSYYQELTEQQTISRITNKFVKLVQFDIKYKIGSGSFSLVYLAHKDNQVYALKQISKEKLLLKNQMKYAITQLNVLVRCRQCAYIIPMYYAFQTPDYLYLALQYIPTGNLGQYIKKKGTIQVKQAIVLLAQLVIAIQFLHSKNIMYRDLKPQNLLISPQGHLYLVDFGLAKQLTSQDQFAQSFLGTPLYLAPQRFTEQGMINIKSDVYGVGCIFYEMLHGQSPFFANNYSSLVHKIKTQEPDIKQNLPFVVKHFLKSTLQKNPQKRISKMSSHDIFKSLTWKQIKQRRHPGIKMNQSSIYQNVQINYKIDEDYTQQNFPNKFINHWSYNYKINK